MTLELGEILRGHKNMFGDLAVCHINEMVYFSEFEAEPAGYEENCSMADSQTFTIKDQNGQMIYTICGNHISQLEELGASGFIELYQDDLDIETWDMDGDYPLETMLELIIANSKKFE